MHPGSSLVSTARSNGVARSFTRQGGGRERPGRGVDLVKCQTCPEWSSEWKCRRRAGQSGAVKNKGMRNPVAWTGGGRRSAECRAGSFAGVDSQSMRRGTRRTGMASWGA